MGVGGAVKDGRDAADHKMGPLATKADLGNCIHSGTAATPKQEHTNDADTGGTSAQERLSRRKVVSNVNSIINFNDHRDSTILEYEGLSQKLAKGGLPERQYGRFPGSVGSLSGCT